MNPGQKPATVRLASLFVLLVLASCGGSNAGTDRSAFAGQWTGTKTYLNDDGSLAGSLPWALEIVDTGPGALTLTGGVGAQVDSPSGFTVGRFTYQPEEISGGPGHCVPTTWTVTGGTGALGRDQSLTMTLKWTYACGSSTGASTTIYQLQPAAGISLPSTL